ncbi:hypothetical protein L484_014307 [Morus notabilis]|uniref:DNA-directed RNA polymerase n=1 Tax=Morus notabilis TaxID=981085 RepID=W9RMC4_9ROSA|nr:hypothetical protein L484_014307 [Morus notabilis]
MALVVTGGAKNGAFRVILRSHEERELVGFVLRWSKRRKQKAAREVTSHILDQVKTLGFRQATATSISLGIDDLLTIPSKGWLVQDAEQQRLILEKYHHYGNVRAVEKLRQSIEIWYATSEYLRQEMNPTTICSPYNNVLNYFNKSACKISSIRCAVSTTPLRAP